MNIRSVTSSCLAVTILVAVMLTHCTSEAQNNWLGGTSSDWTNDANWSGTAPPTGGTYSTRINVDNGSNNALYYTSTQGTTIFNATDGALRSSSSSGGAMFITGGLFDSRGTAQDFIGRNGSGTNRLTIDGGTYTNVNGGSTELLLFYGGGSTGNLTIITGSLISGTIKSGFNSSQAGNGFVNLNGGLLSTGRIFEGGSASANTTINFNGGTLQARGDQADFIATAVNNANVLAGGAIIDTQSFNVTIAKALSGSMGDGGLTKQANGTLTLNGTNTYAGATLVSAGTLALGSAGSITTSSGITVASGATFNVSAVAGGWALGASQTLGGNGTIIGSTTINGILNPGNSPGILVFNDALTLNGTTVMDIDGATRGTGYDGIDTGAGLLTYGGALTLDFGVPFAPDTYVFDLFNIGAGGQTGDFTSVALAGSYSGALNNIGSGVWQRVDGGNSWTFSQSTGQLTFVAVPEPSTLALGGIAIGLAAGFCRSMSRRRQQPTG